MLKQQEKDIYNNTVFPIDFPIFMLISCCFIFSY